MPQTPLLAKFSNEKARVTADQLDSAFNTIATLSNAHEVVLVQGILDIV